MNPRKKTSPPQSNLARILASPEPEPKSLVGRLVRWAGKNPKLFVAPVTSDDLVSAPDKSKTPLTISSILVRLSKENAPTHVPVDGEGNYDPAVYASYCESIGVAPRTVTPFFDEKAYNKYVSYCESIGVVAPTIEEWTNKLRHLKPKDDKPPKYKKPPKLEQDYEALKNYVCPAPEGELVKAFNKDIYQPISKTLREHISRAAYRPSLLNVNKQEKVPRSDMSTPFIWRQWESRNDIPVENIVTRGRKDPVTTTLEESYLCVDCGEYCRQEYFQQAPDYVEYVLDKPHVCKKLATPSARLAHYHVTAPALEETHYIFGPRHMRDREKARQQRVHEFAVEIETTHRGKACRRYWGAQSQWSEFHPDPCCSDCLKVSITHQVFFAKSFGNRFNTLGFEEFSNPAVYTHEEIKNMPNWGGLLYPAFEKGRAEVFRLATQPKRQFKIAYKTSTNDGNYSTFAGVKYSTCEKCGDFKSLGVKDRNRVCAKCTSHESEATLVDCFACPKCKSVSHYGLKNGTRKCICGEESAQEGLILVQKPEVAFAKSNPEFYRELLPDHCLHGLKKYCAECNPPSWLPTPKNIIWMSEHRDHYISFGGKDGGWLRPKLSLRFAIEQSKKLCPNIDSLLQELKQKQLCTHTKLVKTPIKCVGKTIKICPDCTRFEGARQTILLQGEIDQPTPEALRFYDLVLRRMGLPSNWECNNTSKDWVLKGDFFQLSANNEEAGNDARPSTGRVNTSGVSGTDNEGIHRDVDRRRQTTRDSEPLTQSICRYCGSEIWERAGTVQCTTDKSCAQRFHDELPEIREDLYLLEKLRPVDGGILEWLKKLIS